MFSCIAYTEAQAKACSCVNRTELVDIMEVKLKRENPEAYKLLKEQANPKPLTHAGGTPERVRTGPRVSAQEKGKVHGQKGGKIRLPVGADKKGGKS